ncbi:hypothetical protein [Micromonospora sp. NPDC004551]|uniref:hypothetical protein n=1 Tax=Micromonospora sp. NPDC004551 TaxID=3154284 RepID=UPI0033BDC59F
MPCDEVTLGLADPEYRTALHAAGHDLPVGLVVTGAGEGKLGSSIVVFTRLVAILSVLVAVGPESVDAARVWTIWDEAWPGRP